MVISGKYWNGKHGKLVSMFCVRNLDMWKIVHPMDGDIWKFFHLSTLLESKNNLWP
jgi:hypothetical protein